MREDFVAFILTHGRPDNVKTLKALDASGYTGRWFLVVDDEDATCAQYQSIYGDDRVLVFSKRDMRARGDDMMPSTMKHGSVLEARNVCWELAERVGARHFVQLDDDYGWFGYRMLGKQDGDSAAQFHGWKIKSIDGVFESLAEFLDASGAKTIAMAQGGDYMGGTDGNPPRFELKRKAMNSFVCATARPFEFVGRVNDDVNTYVLGSRRGDLFFTYRPLQLNQEQTQQNEGGLTSIYRSLGTYVKSFLSVMVAPSCVRIGSLGRTDHRVHHAIDWGSTAPKIVRATHQGRRILG